MRAGNIPVMLFHRKESELQLSLLLLCVYPLIVHPSAREKVCGV